MPSDDVDVRLYAETRPFREWDVVPHAFAARLQRCGLPLRARHLLRTDDPDDPACVSETVTWVRALFHNVGTDEVGMRRAARYQPTLAVAYRLGGIRALVEAFKVLPRLELPNG